MKGKRELLAKLLWHTGAVHVYRTAALRRRLPILAYHRVLPPANVNRAPDIEVVDATVPDFERQIAFLSRHFTCLLPSQVLAMARGQEPWPANPIMVTFDDGYKDNSRCALPVLQRYGVRAAFFVAPYYVQERRLFWWDMISYCFRNTREARVEFNYPERAQFDLQPYGDVLQAAQAFVRIVKTTRSLDIDRLKRALEKSTHVSIPEDTLVEENVATWQDVRELCNADMEIGSHTYTHRNVTTLSRQELFMELRQSKQLLEEKTGQEVTCLSYPSGDYTPDTGRMARELGYECGFCYNGRPQPKNCDDLMGLSRLCLDRRESFSLFRCRVMLPGAF